MYEAIDALGQVANSCQYISNEFTVHSFSLRVPSPNVYHAHVGTSGYGRVKQIPKTVLPHPVLRVESVGVVSRQLSLFLPCLRFSHLADLRKL